MSDDEKKRPLTGRALHNQIDAGSRFTFKRDPDDEQWDIVTLRVPNARIKFGHEAKIADECDLSGPKARLRQHRFMVANAESILRQALIGSVPNEVVTGLSEMIHAVLGEIRTQEAQVDAPSKEEIDVNVALARAAAKGEAEAEKPAPGKIILLR